MTTATASRLALRFLRNTAFVLFGVVGCALGLYFSLEVLTWYQNMSGLELFVMAGGGISAVLVGLYCIAAMWSDLVEPWN